MELGYRIYMILLALFTLPIFIVPFLAASDSGLAGPLYSFYGLSCHQFISRSICYFPGYGISDCTSAAGLAPYRIHITEKNGMVGYPFPVCARDLGIYLAALASGLLLIFLKKENMMEIPNPLFFILALVPIALDGGTQLIGLRESTNFLRLLTGGIAGFAFSFYCVPLMNRAFAKKDGEMRPGDGKEGEKK
ncbi:MAG: DUF2085 domain-containing protein [Candidatus ainarchaeum sp.]|nr:DUF2085 domain-containing protein [Candidatus ainarchaeum sp.]